MVKNTEDFLMLQFSSKTANLFHFIYIDANEVYELTYNFHIVLN